MKFFAPEYVQRFKCTAQNCRHNCCIGWGIDVDCETLKLYRTMPDKRIVSTVEKGNDGESCHFRLDSNKRCVNLTEEGLCRIILEHGSDYIPEICREHPRFYNRTIRGLEMGIGMSCEEACRIILTSDDYGISACGISEDVGEDCPKFDSPKEIKEIYFLLSNKSLPFPERFEKILELYDIPKSIFEDISLWQDVFTSLEYLDKSHKPLFQKYNPAKIENSSHPELLERALAYYIFRHASPAVSLRDFKLRLALSLVLTLIFASLLSSEKCDDEGASELGRVISEELEYSEDNIDALLLELEFLT